jgi:hypothetical protein
MKQTNVKELKSYSVSSNHHGSKAEIIKENITEKSPNT